MHDTRIVPLIGALVCATLLGACSSSSPVPPPSPRQVAMAFYCSDLTALQGNLTLAKSDPGKFGAAEVEGAGKLLTDADRLEQAGDASAARSVRLAAVAVKVDGEARQQAGADPALLLRTDTSAAAAMKNAPSC